MSELLEPVHPTVVMSNAVHVYVSQAHKGELVMGAGVDTYNGYGQRGAFHVIERQMAAAVELFPIFARAHVLRTWAGVVDTTPDASPIVGETPVENLYVNCGWGTGGFKATPGIGAVMAELLDTGRGARAGRRTSDWTGSPAGASSTNTAPPRWRTEAADMMLITCPECGPRNENEFHYGGQAHVGLPGRRRRDADRVEQWAEYLFVRDNPKGAFAERWVHSAGCRRWFNAIRDTATYEFLAVYASGEPAPHLHQAAPPGGPAMTPTRLPTGGRIDRNTLLDITFDGAALPAHPGDTLASALLAADHRIVAHSVQLGRPRGITSAGAEEPTALVQIERPFPEPMLTATTVEAVDGLAASSISGRGRLAARGRSRRVRRGAPSLRGRRCRRRAGRPGGRHRCRAHRRPGAAGRRATGPGGALLTDTEIAWAAGLSARLAALPNVTHLQRTTVAGYYDDNFLVAVQRFGAGRPAGTGPGTGAGGSGPPRWCSPPAPTSGRSCSAATIVPGVMLAESVRAYLHALRRARRTTGSCCSPPMTTPTGSPATCSPSAPTW